MKHAPVLLIGGYGAVGRWTSRFLREAHPHLELLIGGRDLAKASAFAAELGHAEGVAVELDQPDLGLGDRAISAIALIVKDERHTALRFAQARRVPHVSISSASFEIAPEVSTFMHDPGACAVVLGGEWLAGAATLPALYFAKKFAQLDDIRIDVVLDEQDGGGPAAQSDIRTIAEIAPAALTRRDGKYYWRAGDDAKVVIHALDGTALEGSGNSPFDIAALATATGAPNVQLNIAVGVTSSRRRGEPASHEILITLAGTTRAGESVRERHAIVHPQGEAPLTALGVAMMVEQVLGLSGKALASPGLYYPEHLIAPEAYMPRLRAIGALVRDA
ncbi:MAG: NAD(P)-dependent oxidoreductase [Polyangiales bacterium]